MYYVLKSAENVAEEYLEVVSELLTYNEFLYDYNHIYSLAKDIKKCQKINKEM